MSGSGAFVLTCSVSVEKRYARKSQSSGGSTTWVGCASWSLWEYGTEAVLFRW